MERKTNILSRKSPLISIIIPIYNSQDYIFDTVLSCINQSYKNIEIILINDGSTDNSEIIIAPFLNDSRIKYFKIQNSGASDARNYGIKQATGMLYQFLDSDDLIDNDKLSDQLKYYEDYGDDHVYSSSMGTVSGSVKTREEGYELFQKNFTPGEYFETTLNRFGKYITTGAWLVPLKLIKSTYGWDSRAGLNDDGEYFMRIILNSAGIVYCKGSKFYYRREVPNSFSKQFNNKEVYIKWLQSYTSYVKNFLVKFDRPTAERLGWKALSIYYCNSYPNYPDLLMQCKMQMRELGYKHPAAYGGTLFILASKVFGTENTLIIQNVKKKLVNRIK